MVGRSPFTLKAVAALIASLFVVHFALRSYGPFVALSVLIALNACGGFRLLTAASRGTAPSSLLREALIHADLMEKPIVDKYTSSAEDDHVRVGLAAMQGWRRKMEDAHSVILQLTDTVSFFGVYDGHNGATVAKFCAAELHKFVAQTPQFSAKQYQKALEDGFVKADLYMVRTMTGERSGCTANVILLDKDASNGEVRLYCSNAGDSRAVLCRRGRAVALSVDHKPTLDSEKKRIENARSFVLRGRVKGNLALSRALGDFPYKNNPNLVWTEQAVTALPQVTTTALDPKLDEFAILACDGIWDVMSNDAAVSFVRTRIKDGVPPSEICTQLADACLSPTPLGFGCDNMSVIIVIFKHPVRPQEEPTVLVSSGHPSREHNTSPTKRNPQSPVQMPLHVGAGTAGVLDEDK